jgi:hypothetical protein
MPRSGGDNRPRSAAALRHQTFDSNCNDVRVRGNAWQVNEKYQALARDASSSGDRVAAENYLQHAEHYFRVIEAINEATAVEQRQRTGGTTSFGPGQPEMPANYYAPDGTLAAAHQQPGATPEGQAQTQQPEATVQPRNTPSSPFFTQEEIEEQNGDQTPPLTARR